MAEENQIQDAAGTGQMTGTDQMTGTGQSSDLISTILTRRSIRSFTAQPIPPELLTRLMQAAMSAPSAHNEQPWHFILITDKALLKTASVLSPHMAMLPSAAAAILVCADKDLEKSPGLWSMDCAAASQNILLAAHSSGLGAVWTAIYPRQDRIDGFKAAFNLPLSVIPFAMIPLGYPAETPAKQDRFKAERIHFDKW